MKPTISDLPPAVQRGAAWLDEHVPGWAARVPLPLLALTSVGGRLLGQLSRDHPTGLAFARGRGAPADPELRWAAHHGFPLAVRVGRNADARLNALWKAEVARRLRARAHGEEA